MCGFWFEESQCLLNKALSLESKCDGNSETLSFSYLVSSFWYENHGEIAKCLARAYRSWESTENKVLKNYAAIYIAYQLALLDEFDACNSWVKRVDISSQPQFSVIRIYNHLIDALKYSNNESLVEKNIIRAEWSIDRINYLAPIKARILYIKSTIEGKWGLLREANVHYRDYATIHARHYATTDGATYILTASEVHRLTSIGATTAANNIVNEKLDPFQLLHPGYALSVKQDVCLSYCEYYRAINLPLYNTYCEMGKKFAEKTIPSEETLSILSRVFGGKVPDAISGEMTLWIWEYQNLQNLVADQDVSRAKIKMQIEHLKERFPCHHNDLEVISASLLDSYAATHAWHMLISSSERIEKFDVALQCARLATSLGLIWDGADFYNIVLSTDGFKKLTKYQRIDVLLEVAANFERCNARREARLIWSQLESLAKGTSKLADVYQARGNYSYDNQQYYEALGYYDKCLTVVLPEEGLIDQRLSSIYAFRSSCFCALGNYQASYDDAVKAKLYFPMQDFDAFTLEYNHGFLAICLKKYKEARVVLTRAKTLASTKDDKDAVDELLAILAMKIEEREAYFKQILYNFDTQIDID